MRYLFIVIIAVYIALFNIPSKTTYAKSLVPEVPEPLTSSPNYVKASITKYGATGNVMANGEHPHLGAVAVSDRTIPFGTKIIINNKEYIVKDRTAKWIHEQKGFTVDIYSEETHEEMLRFGRQVALIEIK